MIRVRSQAYMVWCVRGSRFLNDEKGQGLIEYAILAALISIAAVSLILAIGQQVIPLFQIPLNAL